MIIICQNPEWYFLKEVRLSGNGFSKRTVRESVFKARRNSIWLNNSLFIFKSTINSTETIKMLHLTKNTQSISTGIDS